MKKIAYLLGYFVAFIVIFYASSALAATPQEIVNQTLANYESDAGMQMSGDMHVELKETIRDNTYYKGPESAIFDIQFDQRTLPKDEEGYQDGEGFFRFKKLSIESTSDEFSFDQPITIFWKSVAPMMYIKLDKLPDALSQQLQSMEIDLSAITQRWFATDAPKDDEMRELLPLLTAEVDPASKLTEMFKNLGDKQILQVVKTEKKFKNAAGEDLVRVRLGINRAILYTEYKAELTRAYKITKYKERQAAIKAAREEYNKNLADAKALHMAANVNLTKQKLERVEFGMTQSEDKEDCEWNDEWTKQTCCKVGVTTVKFQAGIWLKDLDMTPIAVPYGAINLDEAEEFFAKAFGM